MTLTGPNAAMLWEHWRLTRVEAVQRMAIGLVGASAALAVSNTGAAIAVWILLSQHGMFWMSIAKLTGGRFVDGYRPGFPLHLQYSRPVTTRAIVGVAMAYDALSCTAMYLASAALLGFAFGQPLPLLSLAALIATFHAVCTAIQWSTQSRVVQWVGSAVVSVAAFGLLTTEQGVSPLHVRFSLIETALFAAVALAAFALTVAGVARQRRGDSARARARTTEPVGFQMRLASLLPLACPTSSAARAQVWFDLKASGLPILAVAAGIATVSPLVFVLAAPFAWLRPFALGCVMYAVPVILVMGGNAFGIRRKQGRVFASVFDSTLPSGTARLAAFRILTRTACLLIALVTVGASLWASSWLVTTWMGDARAIALDASFWELPNSRRGELIGVSAHAIWAARHALQERLGSLSSTQVAALAVLLSSAVAIFVSLRAAFTALHARYPRRVYLVGSMLLAYGLAFTLRARAGQGGDGWEVVLLDALFEATPWLVASISVFVAAYLFWRVLAERLVTLPSAIVVVLLSVMFPAVGMTLGAAEPSLGAMTAAEVARQFSPALVPLVTALAAPWSLSRIRHM